MFFPARGPFCLLLLLSGFSFPSDARLWAEETSKRNYVLFGKLPARFNGRVTTYDAVAKNDLRRFSGRDVCFDQADKPRPAVEWLLDVMIESKQADRWRIFHVAHPELRDLLELAPHKDSQQTKFHYAVQELQPKFKVLEERHQTMQAKSSADRGALDQAVADLYEQLFGYLSLKTSFVVPPVVNRETAGETFEKILQLADRQVPLFVPKADGREWRWWLFLQEGFNDLISEGGKKEERNELFRQLQAVLQAARDQDAKAFNAAVEKYLQATQAIPSPFQFTVPAGWLEMGVPAFSIRRYYQDADAMGHRVAEFLLAGTHYSEVVINHFVGQDVSLTELDNSWRITVGLAPLSPADLKRDWQRIQIGGKDAILMDRATPEDVEIADPKRYVTAVLQAEGQTLVFGWSGSHEQVAKHLDSFKAFLSSVKIESMEELSQWFQAEGEREPLPPVRILAAVVPDGKRAWVFVIASLPELVKERREEFLAFLKTVKFSPQPNGRTKLEWTLPADWKQTGGYGEETFRVGTGDTALPMTILPLGEAGPETLSHLIDYWCAKIHCEQVTPEQRKSFVREMMIAGRTASLVDLQCPMEEATIDEITFQGPDHWTRQPKGPLLTAAFEVGDGEQRAKITIVPLPHKPDSLAPNVNRWRAQIDLEEQTAEQILKAAEAIRVDGLPGKLVDLNNPNTNQRILAVVVPKGDQDWYFKLMGPTDLVEKESKAFREFVKSAKFAR